MPKEDGYDVVFIGGGIAGLTGALQLLQQRPGTRVAVVEKRALPVDDGAAHKVGESVAESAAFYFRHFLGLDEYMRDTHWRKMGLRWFCSNGENSDLSKRVEYGLQRYTGLYNFHVDRGTLERDIHGMAVEAGAEIIDETTVASVQIAEGEEPHVVTLGRGDDAREITCRWVVDASGRQALLRRQLKVGYDLPIDASASWFRVPEVLKIDDWVDDAEWREEVDEHLRHKSTVSLVGEGYWVWIINMNRDTCSVGVVADPKYVPFDRIRRYDDVLDFLREHEPQLASKLPDSEEGVLDFHKRKDFAAGCTRAFSRHRWALTGEAAAFLDPLYSTGLDFMAISNTLVTDLVTHDLDGAGEADLRTRVRVHNRSFLGIAALGLPLFHDQLEVYRSPQAMGAKFLWDNAIYFSILLNLFKNRALTDVEFVKSLQPEMKLNATMLQYMEDRFREWSRPDWDISRAGLPIGTDLLWENLFFTPQRDLTLDELREHVRESLSRLQTLSRAMIERFCEAAGKPLPEVTYDPPPELDEELVIWAEYEPGTRAPALPEGATKWHAHGPLGAAVAA